MLKRGWLLALALAPLVSTAEEEPRPYGLERPLDFALGFSQRKLMLDRQGTPLETTLKRITASWREHYGNDLTLGLLGGYSFVTQSNNPPTAGLELDGYHAGVSIDLRHPLARRMQAFAGALYLYERVDEDAAGQKVELNWSQWQAEIGLALDITPTLRAYGAGTYTALDGEERLRGASNSTQSLDLEDRTGALAGLELTLEDSGYVGVAGRTEPQEGITIYFGRRF